MSGSNTVHKNSIPAGEELNVGGIRSSRGLSRAPRNPAQTGVVGKLLDGLIDDVYISRVVSCNFNNTMNRVD